MQPWSWLQMTLAASVLSTADGMDGCALAALHNLVKPSGHKDSIYAMHDEQTCLQHEGFNGRGGHASGGVSIHDVHKHKARNGQV